MGIPIVRNTFTITITDYRGARHYPVRHIVKLYALGVLLTLAATLLVGGLVIVWLNSQLASLNGELAELQKRRNLTQGEYGLLLQEHQKLKDAIAEKERQLAQMSDELGNLEVIIGLEPAPETNIRTRLDTASQTALERTLMLQSIPSGYPLEYRGTTSAYGYRTHPVKGTQAFHAGIDLRAQVGTPIYATADGIVEWAAEHKSSGLGILVIIQHNFGFATYYGHLSRAVVKPGDYVRKGDLIAYSGNTGLSSGPHLHYEVRHLQRRLDPRPFLEWSLARYESLFEKEGRVQWDSLAKAIKDRLNIQVPRSSLAEANSVAN
jgi:Membrane proteins related to metalloendopeptidases